MKISEDNKTKSVLTTKNIVASQAEITHVALDEDGDWQFLDDSDLSESDILLVPLGQILELDKTLKDLPNIRRKQAYKRAKKHAKWEQA